MPAATDAMSVMVSSGISCGGTDGGNTEVPAYHSPIDKGAAAGVKVGSNGTVLSTNNGGSKWSARTAPSGDDLYGVSCPSSTSCIAAGSDGAVASTADGGTSWKLRGTGTTDGLHGVSCAPQGACYTAGDYGSLLKATLP